MYFLKLFVSEYRIRDFGFQSKVSKYLKDVRDSAL